MPRSPLAKPPLPIVQSSPHGGLATPEEVRDRLQIGQIDLYNDADLWADMHYDFTAADLADLIPAGYGPGTLAMVTMPIARALIDPNRQAHDLDNPDGPVKTQTSYQRPIYRPELDDVLKQHLLERYYQQFHQQLADALATHSDEMALLLDCHSMAQHGPSGYHDPGAVRPLICLANLGDESGAIRADRDWVSCPPEILQRSAAIAAELFADLSLLEPEPGITPPLVRLNWPFSGGEIMRRYVTNGYCPPTSKPLPPALMVEVNRGLFVGNQSATTAMKSPNEERISAVRRRLYQWACATIELF